MNLTDNCDMATSNEATRARPNGYISAQLENFTERMMQLRQSKISVNRDKENPHVSTTLRIPIENIPGLYPPHGLTCLLAGRDHSKITKLEGTKQIDNLLLSNKVKR